MKTSFLFLFCFFLYQNIYSETLIFSDSILINKNVCETCEDVVPYYPVDLDDHPDSTWILLGKDVVKREGECCLSTDPDSTLDCISFNIYLDEDAVGLIMDVKNPVPVNAAYYSVNCGSQIALGEFICLTGGKTYSLTFCNPGDDRPDYIIQSVAGAKTNDSITINAESECTGSFHVSGFETSTISWSVINPSNADSLISYLDLTDVENPVFHPDYLTPSSITYEVCGILSNTHCDDNPLMDCVEVTVVFNGCNSIISNNDDLLNTTTSNQNGFKIYPNPNSGLFNIEFNTNKSKKALLEIFNSNGQLILKKGIKETNNLFQERINLSDKPNGIYYLRINNNGRIFSKNINIQKG